MDIGLLPPVTSFDRAPQTVLWIEKFKIQNSNLTVITVKTVHRKPLGESREFFFPVAFTTASYERAPVAVPLDTEVPVARGFRRLHARGV